MKEKNTQQWGEQCSFYYFAWLHCRPQFRCVFVLFSVCSVQFQVGQSTICCCVFRFMELLSAPNSSSSLNYVNSQSLSIGQPNVDQRLCSSSNVDPRLPNGNARSRRECVLIETSVIFFTIAILVLICCCMSCSLLILFEMNTSISGFRFATKYACDVACKIRHLFQSSLSIDENEVDWKVTI